MRTWTRREVMAASALGAATLAARTGRADARPDDKEKPKGTAPASESIVLGFIGVGGMGSGLLNTFKRLRDLPTRRQRRRPDRLHHRLVLRQERGLGPESGQARSALSLSRG